MKRTIRTIYHFCYFYIINSSRYIRVSIAMHFYTFWLPYFNLPLIKCLKSECKNYDNDYYSSYILNVQKICKFKGNAELRHLSLKKKK